MSALALVIILAGCPSPPPPSSGLDRCGSGEPPPHTDQIAGRTGYLAWAPPTRSVDHLATLPEQVSGPSPDATGTLAAWTGPTLDAWTRTRHGADLRLRSPAVPDAAGQASWLEVDLRPHGMRSVALVLFSSSGTEVADRVSRATRFLLPAGLDPDAPYPLRIDLRDLVGGNWADAWRQARITGIELTLEGASDGEVEAVRLRDELARYAAPAGTESLELGGILRLGWYVHGGARARVALHVPAGNPELRWAAGALGAGTTGEIAVRDGKEETPLPVRAGGEDWTPQTASLAPWAGRDVSLELSAAGSGIALFGAPRLVSGLEQAVQPDVLLYLIDALRADALHAWGSPVADVSPTLDRLAADGVQFTEAMSTTNWTKPAIPSLMTGIWPTRHQVGSQSFTDRLSSAVPLVQERFRDGGWRTGSFSANPLGSTLSGLDRGFDEAVPPRRWRGQISPMGAPTADQLQAAMLAWVDEEPDLPFFAYVHTLEVHQAYRPPFTMLGSDPRASYEAAIRAADAGLASLLRALDQRRRGRPLLVVLVSDHGESFGDHGLQTHGTGLYSSQVHIPLILWAGQDLPSLRIEKPVSLADVAPTLLSLVGLPPLAEADGLSLRPMLDGKGALDRPWVPSVLLRFAWAPNAPKQFALTDQHLHKVLQRADGTEETYDLADDPCEERPLAPDAGLSAQLTAWRSSQDAAARAFAQRYGAPIPYDLDDETTQQLRQLGYVR